MKYIAKQNQLLLQALAELSPQSSKTTLRSWLAQSRITVNGRIVKLGETNLDEGQEILLKAKPRFASKRIPFLYEDRHIAIIEKPEGLLSVSSAFQTKETVHALLKEHYRPRPVYVVHRLDQDTSGVMVFALTEQARDKLKKIFEKHDIERAYSAIVEGQPDEEKGTWSCHLTEDSLYRVRVVSDPNQGELAITHYEVKKITKKYSWVECTLETGKKNQIRVHCQMADCPVVGDAKYGAKTNPIKRLCLHARLLAFKHPITKKTMRFESEIPAGFYKLGFESLP